MTELSEPLIEPGPSTKEHLDMPSSDALVFSHILRAEEMSEWIF